MTPQNGKVQRGMWVAFVLKQACTSDDACARMKANVSTEVNSGQIRPTTSSNNSTVPPSATSTHSLLTGRAFNNLPPQMDAPSIWAEALKEVENGTGGRYDGVSSLGYRLGNSSAKVKLSELLVDLPANNNDPFARKHAEQDRAKAVAELDTKFVAKYSKPLNTFKVTYVGPALYEDYDFNRGEIVISLCSAVNVAAIGGRSQLAICNPDEYFSTEYSNRAAVVEAVRNLGIEYGIKSLDISKPDTDFVDRIGDYHDYFPRVLLGQQYSGYRVKVSTEQAEIIKKKTEFSSPLSVSTGYNRWGKVNASNLSFFRAQIEMVFDSKNSPISLKDTGQRVGNRIALFVNFKPISICIDDIATGEQYFCGPISQVRKVNSTSGWISPGNSIEPQKHAKKKPKG